MTAIDEIKLPAFGLGCAPIGNLYHAISDAQAIATIHAALEGGIGFIDTAPYYGHGRSESRIGEALSEWKGALPVLSTKAGRVLDPVAPGGEGDFGFADPLRFRPRFDYSRGGVRRSLEGSLARLGVERIDIALIHDIGRQTHGDAHPAVMHQVLDETIPELRAARDEGLLRWIGIGVNECEVCLELLRDAELDCILLAGRYTVLEQPALSSGLLDMCTVRGVRLLAAGVFNSGLLAARPVTTSKYNYENAPADTLARAQGLWNVCESFGVSPQAAAVQFPAAHPAVASTIVGARSPDEIAQIMRWRVEPVPVALWTELKKSGFIAADAPVPGTGT